MPEVEAVTKPEAAPPPSPGFFSKSAPAPETPPQGTAEVIGSPDLFIQERLHQGHGGVRVRQVWIDGTQRGYIIADSSQLGYFELTEGMTRDDAIQAMSRAYDKVAVVV